METLLNKTVQSVEPKMVQNKFVGDPVKNWLETPTYQTLLGGNRSVKLVYLSIFKLVFVEKISDLQVIAERLGCGVENATLFVEDLQAHFNVVSENGLHPERLSLRKLCWECLLPSIVDYSRGEGKILRVCCVCGLEPDISLVSEDFEQRIPMGSTFAPENKLSSTKGLGGTLNHKKYLHKLLHAYGEDYTDFCKRNPEIALALLTNYMVGTETHVYRLMENGTNIVRKIPLEEFVAGVEKLWHGFDKPLRNRSTHLASCEKNSKLKSVLDYAETLVDYYRLNRKDTDNQIFINRLGCDIRKIVPVLVANHKHYSTQVVAETLFYQTLCLFRKTELIKLVKPNLKVACGLINFFNEYVDFERKQKEEDASSELLRAFEVLCGVDSLMVSGSSTANKRALSEGSK
jgi:hypothetical protein